MGPDSFIGSIEIFGGDFAPRNWAFCNGALLQIAQYQALFSIIGTTYGGDGRVTFGLPNLQGRIPLGQGTNPYSGTTYTRGMMNGSETVSLLLSQMPEHTHGATVQTGQLIAKTSQATATATSSSQLFASDQNATQPTATTGASLATVAQTGRTTTQYDTFNTNTPDVELNQGSVITSTQVSLSDAPVDGSFHVTNQTTGGGLPHTNMQPFLVVNFVICLEGNYPPRS